MWRRSGWFPSLVVHVTGPANEKVRVGFTGRLKGRIIASGAKTTSLKHGQLTVTFRLGPRTAAHALIRVSAKLDHETAVTSTLNRRKPRPKPKHSCPVPYPARSYIGYVDDSGNEDLGLLWVALLIPFEQWTEYLRRWLGFRKNLYAKTRVPASHELHAQVWLSPDPLQETEAEGLDALRDDDGELPGVLLSGKEARRERSRWYEKALLTIGTFTDARVLTVYTSEHSGRRRSPCTTSCCASSRSSSRPRRRTQRCWSTARWTAAATFAPRTARCLSSIGGSWRTPRCVAPPTVSFCR
jgi:hypothetical protein